MASRRPNGPRFVSPGFRRSCRLSPGEVDRVARVPSLIQALVGGTDKGLGRRSAARWAYQI